MKKVFARKRMMATFRRRVGEMNEGQRRVEMATNLLIARAAQLAREQLASNPVEFVAELGLDTSETSIQQYDAQSLILALLERAVVSHRDYMREAEVHGPLPGA